MARRGKVTENKKPVGRGGATVAVSSKAGALPASKRDDPPPPPVARTKDAPAPPGPEPVSREVAPPLAPTPLAPVVETTSPPVIDLPKRRATDGVPTGKPHAVAPSAPPSEPQAPPPPQPPMLF